jgi:beta-lactamase superfamily II metal-dependent hydrolase
MALNTEFLNVGKGNTTIIDFPSNRLSIIDIDDSRSITEDDKKLMEKSGKAVLTDPVAYIIQNYSDKEIFRFILTHPDMDHMSGLKRLFDSKYCRNFWDPPNNKSDPGNWENSPYDKNDWDFYQSLRDKRKQNVTVISPLREATADCCWIQDDIQILSPTDKLVSEANEKEDWNISSYVFMLRFADRKILLGGDATKDAWGDLVENYGVDILRSDILLAPHHGSENNITSEILDIIQPRLVIVSVAEGVDYARELYASYGRVLSTKYYGNIQVKIEDNGEIVFKSQFQNYSDSWYVLKERQQYYQKKSVALWG